MNLYKVVIDGRDVREFDGIDAFRDAIRCDLRFTTGMAKHGLSTHDVQFFADTGELLTHTRVGDRVKGNLS